MTLRVFIGWDAREMAAWNVARASLLAHTTVPVHVERVALPELQAKGLYTRPTEDRHGRLWDVISEAPMSTGHANARFLVPALCEYQDWALFMDGDVLVRSDVAALVALADARYAVRVVQHRYEPPESVKMDQQVQMRYLRKNWSSVMLLNCGHQANRRLTVELANTVPGRDLHRFCWLLDEEIGALPEGWNWLAGHSTSPDPALVHFTEGLPNMAGYESTPYADEWREQARACGYQIPEPAIKE